MGFFGNDSKELNTKGQTNNNLRKAKKAKNDEFYTQLVDIENELRHYKEHFKNKIVYLNCDDPSYSNFWVYFHLNFAHLGLKKLVATFHHIGCSVYTAEYSGGNDNDCSVYDRFEMSGNGDFRSEECVEILRRCDIVVTNPPFSLFREYVGQLIQYGKKFIIWGNNNAITYKEIFNLIRDNKIWLGYTVNQTCIFALSSDYPKWDEVVTEQKNDGHKYGKVTAISVFTNCDLSKRHEKLILYKKYTPEEYPTYDNYDAINVDKVADIPMDYDGVMGVPITFLGKFNPSQFEIVGFGQGDIMYDHGVSEEFVKRYINSGQTGVVHKGQPFLVYYRNDGYPVIPYFRVLIQYV